jgi:hypothetical protein
MWGVIFLLVAICISGSGCSTLETQVNDIIVLPVTGRGYTAVKDQLKMVNGVMPEMMNVDFWLERLGNPEEVIMTGEEIKVFNEKIIDEMSEIYDLKSYSSSLNKEELTGFIKEYKIPASNMYGEDGKVLTQDYFDQISANINLSEIKDSNPILYGIIIRKCNLRSFPTDAVVYNSTSNRLDRFQETACYLGEPLLILHESKDHEWVFIQLYNYSGWIKKEDIAVATGKKQLFDYTESKDFVIAVDHCVIENPTTKDEIKLFMGSRVQLLKESNDFYKVSIPNRDGQGNLVFSNIDIAKTEHLNKGYLDYTHINIIKQAFKLLGTTYDWGGKENGYDCSSYVMSIYRTMGIQLPRNSGQQAGTPGIDKPFYVSDTMEQRLKSLETLKPGTALYKPGHTMLYLGSYEGMHYIIHDFMGYCLNTNTGLQDTPIYAVSVSPILMIDDYGDPYLMKLTSALEFKLN